MVDQLVTGEIVLKKQCTVLVLFYRSSKHCYKVNNKIRSFTGVNSSIDYDGVALVINTLFSTIFGRRLGTEWWYIIKR